jgi:hypothetical protein
MGFPYVPIDVPAVKLWNPYIARLDPNYPFAYPLQIK